MEEAKKEVDEQLADASGRNETLAPEEPHEATSKKKERKSKGVRISEKELSELREKAALTDQYFDRLARLQADFENFRKRKEREKLELINYATEILVCELVPILSDFERALLAAEKVPGVKAFVEGVELILKELKKVLKEHGIEEICPLGAPFDPYKHEAVEKMATDEHPEGHVVEVFQTGYALKDRVLQPAAVKVAVAPPTAEEKRQNAKDRTESKGLQDTEQEGKTNE